MSAQSPLAATVVAALLIVAGFVMVGLGWHGAAATLFVPSQIAFGVSGGMVGVALIGTGLGVLMVQMTRLSTARRSRDLQGLISETVEVFAAVRERTAEGTRRLQVPLPPVPAGTAAGVPVASNGQGETITAVRSDAAWRPDVQLVPGGKTFHAAGCRTISKNATPLRLTVEEALAAGLRPCRICGAEQTQQPSSA